jgi:hypothetical protein
MNNPTKMPVAVAKVHEPLSQELFVLYTKWRFFKTLYCTSDENIKLLDESAEFFFVLYGETLRDDIIMSICALTDPASTKVQGKTRNNLTLNYLKSLIPSSDSSLIEKIDLLLKDAKHSWDPFRIHRNRGIGHRDLDTVLKKANNLIPSIDIKDTDTALKLIADILNAVEDYYDGHKTPYHHGVTGTGGVQELIELIKRKNDLEKYYEHKEFGCPLEE